MTTPSMSPLERRHFLKSAGLAAAAGMAATATTASAQGVGDAEIKIAVIGCGGRGSGATAQALSTSGKVKLVAMADAFRDRLDGAHDALKKQHGEKVQVPEENKFTGFDAFQKAIEKADAVILATPPGFRPYHFEAAVNMGKHVFCEKPVATDGPGIRRFLDAVKKSQEKKLKVVVGLQRHYQNTYIDCMKAIHGGVIGDIVAGRVYWNDGGVWVRGRQPGMTEMEYQMRNWYYFNWLCGDHIAEQHIHNLDVFNWVKQAYPVKANGQGGRQVRIGKEFGEIYDHHFVEFTYEDGAVLHSQCRHIKNTFSSVSEHVLGTKGRGQVARELKDFAGNRVWKFEGANNDPYQTEHDRLFAAIRNGEELNNGEYGAKSTLTSILGRMATYSGKEVTWDQALNSKLDLFPERLAWDAQPRSLPDANGMYPIAMPGSTVAF